MSEIQKKFFRVWAMGRSVDFSYDEHYVMTAETDASFGNLQVFKEPEASIEQSEDDEDELVAEFTMPWSWEIIEYE